MVRVHDGVIKVRHSWPPHESSDEPVDKLGKVQQFKQIGESKDGRVRLEVQYVCNNQGTNVDTAV